MSTTAVLQHIKQRGQVLDGEIAKALGIKLAVVHSTLDELSARGEIACCRVTRFLKGQPVEEIQCRISGYIPPAAPGRKPRS